MDKTVRGIQTEGGHRERDVEDLSRYEAAMKLEGKDWNILSLSKGVNEAKKAKDADFDSYDLECQLLNITLSKIPVADIRD